MKLTKRKELSTDKILKKNMETRVKKKQKRRKKIRQ